MAVTAFRLKLDVDEETRARWQAAAERIDYERLDVWARDTLDAASDPDAGQADCRARLTTAETERRELEGKLADANSETDAARQSEANAWQMWNDAKQVLDGVDEAEARVEALSEALREIAEMDNSGYESVSAAHFGHAQRLARAALACPPQHESAGEALSQTLNERQAPRL